MTLHRVGGPPAKSPAGPASGAQQPTPMVSNPRLQRVGGDDPRREQARDDPHGASARALQDPNAMALRNRLQGQGETGFGLNPADAPLRSAAGSPQPSVWANPGAGVVGQLTVHAPEGPLVHARAMARCGSACIMASAIMAGLEHLVSLLATVANHKGTSPLAPEERRLFKSLAPAAANGCISFSQLVKAQELLAKASQRTVPLKDICREASKPANLGRLIKEDQQDLRLYERRLISFTELDLTQRTRLSDLLTRAMGVPVKVVWAWDPLAKDQKRRGLAAVWARGPGVAPAVDPLADEVLTLAWMAGIAADAAEPLPIPTKEGEVLHTLQTMLDQLHPSDTYVVRVHQNEREEHTDSDRLIAVGRRPDGTAFLYNPDPRKNDFTLFLGRPGRHQSGEFNAQLSQYTARIRKDRDGEVPTATRLCFPSEG